MLANNHLKEITSNIIDFILRNGKIIGITILVMTLFFGYQLRNLSVYNEFDLWYKSSDSLLFFYEEFRRAFGNDENIFLIYRSDNLFSYPDLKFNREITEKLEDMEGIGEVISLSTVKIPEFIGNQLIMRPLIPTHPDNTDELYLQISNMPFLVNNIISRDGKSTGFVVFPEDNTLKTEVLTQVKTILREIRLEGYATHIFGPLSMKEEVNQLANRESRKFLLIATAIIIVLLYSILRKLLPAIIPVFIALIAVVWTLGIFTLSGKSMNVINSIMPLIVLVVSIAYSIHFIFSLKESSGSSTSLRDNLLMTFKDVFLPCFYSGLTTAAAFLVFGLSDIYPLVLFGVFSAIGVIISFVLTFVLLPIFIKYFGLSSLIGTKSENPSPSSIYDRFSYWVNRHRKMIILLSIVILIVSIMGITKVRFNADQTIYLKDSNPVTIANNTAVAWFGGIYPTELVLDLQKSFSQDPVRSLHFLEKIESNFGAFEEISSWQSPLVIVKSILPGQGSPESWFQRMGVISNHETLLDNDAWNLLGHYLSDDGKKIRISVKTRWMDGQETLDFIDRLGQSIKTSIAGEEISYHFTGMTFMLSNMSKRLTKSQVLSIICAFIVICLLLLVIYKKFSVALVGMIPNIFPIITTIGLMGWFGIPLDVVTVLLASISLGIAIDDSIHFLNSFLEACKTKSHIEAVACSYRRIGRPITITTLLLIGGFLVMIFSDYMPIIYLGIFVSLNVFLALAYDLVLLPALLLVKD